LSAGAVAGASSYLQVGSAFVGEYWNWLKKTLVDAPGDWKLTIDLVQLEISAAWENALGFAVR
jgi:hypothetical protein